MDIKNLYKGKELKNYNELCMIIGEIPKKGGKSRQLQIKNMERYFKYKKEKSKFIIEEIYPEPKPKLDRRKEGNNNNAKYSEIIKKLMIDILINNANYSEGTLTYFIKKLCMGNVNYIYCEDKTTLLALYSKVEELFIYEFYNLTRRSFRDSFETALNSLKKEEDIIYSKIPIVVTNTLKHRIATAEENRRINEIKEEVLKGMGYKDLKDLIYAGRFKDYKENLKVELLEKLNIKYTYEKYEIKLIKYKVYKNMTTDKTELQEKLNTTIIVNIIKNAKKRHDYAVKKSIVAFGKKGITGVMEKYRIREDYVSTHITIAKLLIDINAENIIPNINQIKTKENC